MPLSPPHRPSTLAAQRFTAAQRPIGWSPDPRTAPNHVATVQPQASRVPPVGVASASAPIGSVRPTGRRAAGPPALRGSAGQANAIATRRSDSEQAIVASVIVAFVILVVGVLGIQVNGSLRTGRGVEAVSATLAEVHQRQQSFRLLNQRFATSQELASMGMLWPSTQTVVRENVTPSHWFMSVRDRDTGVICQKTGELFDESPLEHRATCRSAGS